MGEGRPAPVQVRPDGEVDREQLQAQWSALQDTHDFVRLLHKLSLDRHQALRLIGTEFADEVSNVAAKHMLLNAAPETMPILVFAGNAGCLQIHTGSVTNILLEGHPIRLAEDIATLDVLSGGRVDLGISRGGNGRFMAAYGVSRNEMDKRFDETLETVLKAWSGPMEFNGISESVEPKPVQQPHPPLFIGTHTGSTVEWAARSGYTLICHGITNSQNIERLLQTFRNAGGDVGNVPPGRFVYVSETDASAREELWPVILKLTAV